MVRLFGGRGIFQGFLFCETLIHYAPSVFMSCVYVGNHLNRLMLSCIWKLFNYLSYKYVNHFGSIFPFSQHHSVIHTWRWVLESVQLMTERTTSYTQSTLFLAKCLIFQLHCPKIRPWPFLWCTEDIQLTILLGKPPLTLRTVSSAHTMLHVDFLRVLLCAYMYNLPYSF